MARGSKSMAPTSLFDAGEVKHPVTDKVTSAQTVVTPAAVVESKNQVLKGTIAWAELGRTVPWDTSSEQASRVGRADLKQTNGPTPSEVMRDDAPRHGERAERRQGREIVSPRKGEREAPPPTADGMAVRPPYEVGGISNTRSYHEVTPKIGHEHRVPREQQLKSAEKEARRLQF